MNYLNAIYNYDSKLKMVQISNNTYNVL